MFYLFKIFEDIYALSAMLAIVHNIKNPSKAIPMEVQKLKMGGARWRINIMFFYLDQWYELKKF